MRIRYILGLLLLVAILGSAQTTGTTVTEATITSAALTSAGEVVAEEAVTLPYGADFERGNSEYLEITDGDQSGLDPEDHNTGWVEVDLTAPQERHA